MTGLRSNCLESDFGETCLRSTPSTAYVLGRSPNFPGFLGLLDANGDASLAFRIPPTLAPMLLGTQFTFAGVTIALAGFETAFGPATLVLEP